MRFLGAHAARRFDLVLDQETHDATEVVVTADARHERELRRDAWNRGGDEREATREAEAEQAHAIALDVVLASAEIRDRVSDHRRFHSR